jgi:hypothetical protein
MRASNTGYELQLLLNTAVYKRIKTGLATGGKERMS